MIDLLTIDYCDIILSYSIERMDQTIFCFLLHPSCSLLAQVFDRFEEENGGNLLTATLCLLEASQTGLLEVELLSILGDEDNLMPSSESEAGKEKGKSVGSPIFSWWLCLTGINYESLIHQICSTKFIKVKSINSLGQ